MTGRRITAAAIFVISASAMGYGPASAQMHTRPALHQQAAAEPAGYFGVMGEIGQPGVYAYPVPFPYLVNVIKDAGGLTAEADGNLRIIRRGRDGQNTFYSPSMSFRLLPGDIVVAQSRKSAGGRRFSNRSTPVADETAEKPLQLAFVGAVDRPVVLRVRPEDASVARIVSLLKQRPEVAATVKVVQAGRGQLRIAPDARLPEASVLVFDPSVLEHDQIAKVPPFYHGDPTAGDPATLQTAATNGGIQTAQYRGEGPNGHSPLHGNSAAFGEGRPGLLAPVLPEDGVNAMFADRQIVRDYADEPMYDDETETAEVAEAAAFGSADESNDAGGVSAATLWMLGCFAAMTACVVLYRRARREIAVGQSHTTSRPSPAAHAINPLDAVINGELPLVEEPVRLPETLQFHGRPNGPRKIRVDAVHQGGRPARRPHMPVGRQCRTRTRDVAGVSAEPAAEQAAHAVGANVHAGAAESEQTSARSSLLGRALSSVDGATRR